MKKRNKIILIIIGILIIVGCCLYFVLKGNTPVLEFETEYDMQPCETIKDATDISGVPAIPSDKYDVEISAINSMIQFVYNYNGEEVIARKGDIFGMEGADISETWFDLDTRDYVLVEGYGIEISGKDGHWYLATWLDADNYYYSILKPTGFTKDELNDLFWLIMSTDDANEE